MPSRLRPTASIAADAILVGDPGRALLLAQEVMEQPKMSNHARGLWGYSGTTPAGHQLTIQATGMGGPSAAIVLADLAKLGVRRAVRVGTCAARDPIAKAGDLLLASSAVAAGGSSPAFGVEPGEAVSPDPALTMLLGAELAGHMEASIASVDTLPGPVDGLPEQVIAVDMQTVAIFGRARELEVAAAAVLVVAEDPRGRHLSTPDLEEIVKAAGNAASAALST